MDKEDIEKFIRTKKRVEQLKNFYAHVFVFMVICLLLFLFGGKIVDFFLDKGITDQGFLKWVEWNIVFIPIIWGVVLLIIGIYHFKLKSGFLKNWEARQMRKHLED